jgi:hypothetical protein
MGGAEVVRHATESGIPRIVGAVAAILPFTLLVQALVHPGNYRQPAVPALVWLATLAAAAWLVPRSRAGGLTGRQAIVAIAGAVAAVAVVGLERRASAAAGTVNWSILGTIWVLALVALSRPAWTGVSGALLVLAAHAVFIIRALGVNPLSLSQAGAATYILVVILVVFAGLRPTLRTQADMAARRATLASTSAAERAAAAAVRDDQGRRLALLQMEALPLLRGIADATLDPADRAVQQRCAADASALRRSLIDRPPAGGRLLAGLEPVLRAARDRDVVVEVQVVGDPGEAGPEVAGAALAAVARVLGVLRPAPVTLTILSSADDVEVYLTFGGPQPAATGRPGRPDVPDVPDLADLGRSLPAGAAWRAAVDVDETGTGCLELAWRKAAPG